MRVEPHRSPKQSLALPIFDSGSATGERFFETQTIRQGLNRTTPVTASLTFGSQRLWFESDFVSLPGFRSEGPLEAEGTKMRSKKMNKTRQRCHPAPMGKKGNIYPQRGPPARPARLRAMWRLLRCMRASARSCDS